MRNSKSEKEIVKLLSQLDNKSLMAIDMAVKALAMRQQMEKE
ncbi:hypothetical protein ACTM9B_13400 [Lachnospiraceae bacterium HCP1S3_A10]